MHHLSGKGAHRGSLACCPLDHVRYSCASLQHPARCTPRAGNHKTLRNIALDAVTSGSDFIIESVTGVRREIDAAVEAALDRCLTDTDLGMGNKYRVSHFLSLRLP